MPGFLVRVAAAVLLAVAAFTASALSPHQATYRLFRHWTAPDSDILGVEGRMEIRVGASCDGWRIDQFLGFHLVEEGDDGPATIERVARLYSWESANGRRFWFDTRGYDDRELTEDVGGMARLGPGHGPGAARYARPEARTQPLPAGTRFPAAFLQALIDAARAGERHLLLPVFDGSTEAGLFEVSAFIGPGAPAGGSMPAPLSGLRHWPVRLAYYFPDAVEPEPDFEMSIDLHENGVAGDMVYDYGDLAIGVELTAVEIGPPPRCP